MNQMRMTIFVLFVIFFLFSYGKDGSVNTNEKEISKSFANMVEKPVRSVGWSDNTDDNEHDLFTFENMFGKNYCVDQKSFDKLTVYNPLVTNLNGTPDSGTQPSNVKLYLSRFPGKSFLFNRLIDNYCDDPSFMGTSSEDWSFSAVLSDSIHVNEFNYSFRIKFHFDNNLDLTVTLFIGSNKVEFNIKGDKEKEEKNSVGQRFQTITGTISELDINASKGQEIKLLLHSNGGWGDVFINSESSFIEIPDIKIVTDPISTEIKKDSIERVQKEIQLQKELKDAKITITLGAENSDCHSFIPLKTNSYPKGVKYITYHVDADTRAFDVDRIVTQGPMGNVVHSKSCTTYIIRYGRPVPDQTYTVVNLPDEKPFPAGIYFIKVYLYGQKLPAKQLQFTIK